MKMRRALSFGCLILSIWACAAEPPAPTPTIDERSYRLGAIGAFSEMVAAGVKKLALSSPMSPAEMDGLIDDAGRIARENGANVYRETDLLVTDLFPASLTEGKHVLLIYLDPVKDEYLALKAEKERLVSERAFEGETRLEIARKMGRLLGYADSHIETLLARTQKGR